MKSSAKLFPALTAAFLFVAACGEDTGATTEAETGEGTAGDEGDGDGDGDGDDEGDVWEQTPARGIGIRNAYLNQGVRENLILDGEWAGVESRERAILDDRELLVQALWEYDPENWTPRDIEARLTIYHDDGTEDFGNFTVFVDREANERYLSRSFYWVLPKELVRNRDKFEITLWETEEGWEDEPEYAALPPRAPADGPNWVGVEDSYQKLKVVLVPIAQWKNGSECSAAPEPTEEDIQVFIDDLYMNNPVDEVIMELRDPAIYNGSLASFNGVLGFLAGLRFDDGAPPEYYYYGVFRPCDAVEGTPGGQAISIPQQANKSNANTRVSVGRWYNSAGATAGTFTHEVGHTQGRYHVDCGGAAGTDPAWPQGPEHANGNIGTYGFGTKNFTFYPTTHKDYMTYCSPTWVSDHGWDLAYERIRQISLWDLEAPVPEEEEPGMVMMGLIDADGDDDVWFTVPGRVSEDEVNPNVTVRLHTNVADFDVPAVVSPMGETDDYAVTIELPEGMEELDGVIAAERIEDGEAFPINLGTATIRARE